MDRRCKDVETLPPLELRELRELDLREEPKDGHPRHVASASGVVRRGDHVYVIGDDMLSLAVFRASNDAPGELRPVLADEHDGRKPDLEALTMLPPFEGSPYGALLGVGSGSGEARNRGFAWSLDADGSLRGEPTTETPSTLRLSICRLRLE